MQGAFIMAFAVILLFPTAFYVLHSIGLSSMLKSVGFKKPWFAWLPFCRDFALGGLADQHREPSPPKKRGRKLLILSITCFALTVIYNVAFWRMAFPIIKEYLFPFINAQTIDIELFETSYDSMMKAITAATTTPLTVLSVLADVAKYAYVLYRILILVRVYRIFDEGRVLIYTILSVIIDPALSIIFFIVRKKAPRNLRWQTDDEPPIPHL